MVSEEVWDQLDQPILACYYAKTTVCHEIGHAVLHVPVLRRKLMLTDVLSRVQRRRLRAYEDPGWQALAFAGSILMPSATLRMLGSRGVGLTPTLVCDKYQISLQMARSHLRRLKWIGTA